MKKFLIVGLIVLVLIARKLFLNHLIRKFNAKQAQKNRYFKDNIQGNDIRKRTVTRWREDGNYRRPRKTVIKRLEELPETEGEYVFEDSLELPKSMEEAFRGLTDEEIGSILDEIENTDAEETV